jgi:hypothetical protein|tara:strand:+ start:149 stop:427 length:279 start_codon:yes stop_codon:yes gene_type:complete
MAPRPKPYSEKGESARYYADNPAARIKKAKTDKQINRRPKQVQKRVEANAARRRAKRAGVQLTGRDASHQPNGTIKFENSAKNRGRRGEGNR